MVEGLENRVTIILMIGIYIGRKAWLTYVRTWNFNKRGQGVTSVLVNLINDEDYDGKIIVIKEVTNLVRGSFFFVDVKNGLKAKAWNVVWGFSITKGMKIKGTQGG